MSFWKIFGRSDWPGQSRDSSSTAIANLDTALPPAESRNTFNRDEVEGYGIAIVAQPETGVPCDVDIVCIHGNVGYPEDTSLSEPQGFFWPSWITRDIPNSRVMTFGWDGGSSGMIDHFARDLLLTLSRRRKGTSVERRPIMFVAHGLGGLLVRRAMCLAKPGKHNTTRLTEVSNSTIGIVFLGTQYSNNVPKDPVDEFDELLTNRHSHGSPVHIQVFYEVRSTRLIGDVLAPRTFATIYRVLRTFHTDLPVSQAFHRVGQQC